MAPTCVFLASKVEEFGVVSNTRLIAAATCVLKTRFSYAFPKEFPYKMNHVSILYKIKLLVKAVYINYISILY